MFQFSGIVLWGIYQFLSVTDGPGNLRLFINYLENCTFICNCQILGRIKWGCQGADKSTWNWLSAVFNQVNQPISSPVKCCTTNPHCSLTFIHQRTCYVCREAENYRFAMLWSFYGAHSVEIRIKSLMMEIGNGSWRVVVVTWAELSLRQPALGVLNFIVLYLACWWVGDEPPLPHSGGVWMGLG